MSAASRQTLGAAMHRFSAPFKASTCTPIAATRFCRQFTTTITVANHPRSAAPAFPLEPTRSFRTSAYLKSMDISIMSVKELRSKIDEAGLPYKDCIEKSELQDRCREALALLKEKQQQQQQQQPDASIDAEDAKIRAFFPTATVHEDHLGPGAKQYSLQHTDCPDVQFSSVVFMQREGQIGVMHGVVAHAALPLMAAVKLVKHVVEHADQPPMAAVALSGLCEWVREIPSSELQAEFGADLAETVGAIAHGTPLEQHVYAEAEPAWLALAGRFTDDPAAEEVRLYVAAGYSKDIWLQPMSDKSPGGMERSGGTMALLRIAPA
jgi:hypothetical protein